MMASTMAVRKREPGKTVMVSSVTAAAFVLHTYSKPILEPTFPRVSVRRPIECGKRFGAQTQHESNLPKNRGSGDDETAFGAPCLVRSWIRK